MELCLKIHDNIIFKSVVETTNLNWHYGTPTFYGYNLSLIITRYVSICFLCCIHNYNFIIFKQCYENTQDQSSWYSAMWLCDNSLALGALILKDIILWSILQGIWIFPISVRISAPRDRELSLSLLKIRAVKFICILSVICLNLYSA